MRFLFLFPQRYYLSATKLSATNSQMSRRTYSRILLSAIRMSGFYGDYCEYYDNHYNNNYDVTSSFPFARVSGQSYSPRMSNKRKGISSWRRSSFNVRTLSTLQVSTSFIVFALNNHNFKNKFSLYEELHQKIIIVRLLTIMPDNYSSIPT